MAIQWYPGHIAKAERQLKAQLRWIDVAIEVRDARIPLASHHPQLPAWLDNKPRLTVLNRMDAIPRARRQQWAAWFRARGERVWWTNAQQGSGVPALKKAAQALGEQANERRRQRGMRPRAVRAAALGFPNVGKSALINRLVGRKAAASARRAGVTRQLNWIRLARGLDLLDAPGVMPPQLDDPEAAMALAICGDIGEGAYDSERVAAATIDWLLALGWADALHQRYGIEASECGGEAALKALAERRFSGQTQQAADRILTDFRQGRLGAIALELPPSEP